MTDEPNTPFKVDFGRSPFELTKVENAAILKLVGNMDLELGKEFERRLRPQLDGIATDLVIDLTECGTIHSTWTRFLMQIVAQTKQANNRVRVATRELSHRTFFQDQGISASLPIFPTVETALQDLAAKRTSKLDVNILNPFLDGTREILKVQARLVCKPGTLAAKDPAAPFDDIACGTPFNSDSFSGRLVLSFPAAVFLKIVSQITGVEIATIVPEVRLRAVELAAAIAGYAKRVLIERGFEVKVAAVTDLSTVPTPPDSKAAASETTGTITRPSWTKRISIPFTSDFGNFSIEVSF